MPILGVVASSTRQGQVSSDTGAMFPLQVVTVGSAGASSVTFTNIPSTYKHLQLRILGRATGAERAELRFNNDSGASAYDTHRLTSDGTTLSSDARINRSALWLASAGPIGIANTSSYATMLLVDILDYANTNKYKVTRTFSGTDQNGSGSLELTSGSWKNTAAITRIDLTIVTYIWAQNTSIALYGIKGA